MSNRLRKRRRRTGERTTQTHGPVVCEVVSRPGHDEIAAAGIPAVSARAEEIVTNETINAVLHSQRVRAEAARAEIACQQGNFIRFGDLCIPTGGDPDGRDMDFITVLLTPKIAAPMRGRYCGGRIAGANAIRRIVKSVEDDKFLLTHQCIGIDVDGNMFDGNHRTGAVVKSGKPILITIAYNCSLHAVKYTDLGRARNVGDAIALSPYGFAHCAMVGRMVKEAMQGISFAGYARIPTEMIVRAAETYHEQVKWVFRYCAPKRGMRGPFYGAVLRATIAMWDDAEDLARVAEFCSLFRESGHTGGGNCPLNKLLQYIQSPGSYRRQDKTTDAKELYLRTSAALRLFVERKELKAWSIPKDDIWPFDFDSGSVEIDSSDEGLQ